MSLSSYLDASPQRVDELEIQQIASLQTLEDVRLSPDAEHVAYVIGEMSTPVGSRQLSEIWIVPTGKAVSRRLLAEDRTASEPRWSPNGRRIAYISSRNGEPQRAFTIKPDGTDERPLQRTDGASGIEWSPNGEYLSFVRRDPSVPARSSNDPIISGTGVPRQLWIFDFANESVHAITGSELNIARDYVWSPDGTEIAFAAESATEWIAGRQALHIAAVTQNETRLVSNLHDRTIGLAWSPDGKQIVWCGREHAPESGQLVVFDAEATHLQSGRPLHTDFPASIQWIDFLPDGRLALAALLNMQLGLFSTSLDGSAIGEVGSRDDFKPGSLGAGSWGRFTVSLSADGRHFATRHSGPNETGNVVTGEWKRPKASRTLTRLNSQIEQVSLGETEEISWLAPDGLRIYGLLIKPVGYEDGQRYPMIVELHGGPRRSFWDTSHVSDSWGQLLATRGYLVLLPNPRGSEGRGAEFIRAGTDTGVADLPDVLAGVDYVVERGDADPDRLGIGGWSYGGFLTAWAITQTQRFKAAVVGAGYVNQISREGQTRGNWQYPLRAYEEPERLLRNSPIMFMKGVKAPTLIIHGDNDNTVPTVQSVELYTALRSLGIRTERVLYPGENHIFTDRDHVIDRYRRILAWFDKYVKYSSDSKNVLVQ